jgi:hypothetical protein
MLSDNYLFEPTNEFIAFLSIAGGVKKRRPVGAVGSAVSLVLDLIPDVTFSPYFPSIPR